jgi:hypothetical protein
MGFTYVERRAGLHWSGERWRREQGSLLLSSISRSNRPWGLDCDWRNSIVCSLSLGCPFLPLSLAIRLGLVLGLSPLSLGLGPPLWLVPVVRVLQLVFSLAALSFVFVSLKHLGGLLFPHFRNCSG